MIRSLHIRNYALIRSLDIALGGGVTAITGETGAGKSILVGALGLLLGKRADSSVLFDKTNKCVVEAEILLVDKLFPAIFDNYDLDFSDVCIIRREIASSGRSRAFINDTPVKLPILQDIGTRLINIHSQHDTLLVNNTEFRFSLLDSAAGIEQEAARYRDLYREVRELSDQLEQMKNDIQDAGQDADFLNFQMKELEDAQLREGEAEELSEQLKVLANAEYLITALSQADEMFTGADGAILTQMHTLSRILKKSGDYSKQVSELSIRLESALIELEDIAAELSSCTGTLDIDEEKLQELEERNDLINRLLTKHRAKDVNELIGIKERISSRLAGAESLQKEVKRLQNELDAKNKLLHEEGVMLSGKRRKKSEKFISDITSLLRKLYMPDAVLAFEFKSLDAPGPYGVDDIEWLFSANKGHRYEPLSKVASGGELSRLMLALKAVAGERHNWPTLILDEIDTGISGETAVRVSELMNKMGRKQQLLVITHLPQIAGASDCHLHVLKTTNDGKTSTEVKVLNEVERINVLAGMISGARASTGAVAHARQLLERKN